MLIKALSDQFQHFGCFNGQQYFRTSILKLAVSTQKRNES